MAIDLPNAQPSIIDRLRNLLPRREGVPRGVGVFYLGGGKGQYMGQAWDFIRISNSVYGNPTGFRCVEAISYNLARPPWVLYPQGTSWPQVGETNAIKTHPLLDLLRKPNPTMSGTMMQRFIGRDLELTGKSFWLKDRDQPQFGAPGKLTALRRLPAQRVTVVGNQDDELLGFVYTDKNGRQAPSLPENMLYLRYPHPERAYDGLAPALVAGMSAETDNASARFNRDLLSNDSAIPGYLVIDGLSPQDFAEWKSMWESGAVPGKTRFLGGQQSKYFKVGQTNQELTYKELREDSQDDVMRAFGVPRAVAFDVSHETYANAEREQALFMQHNIFPKWGLICDEMTLQLAQEFPQQPVIALDLTGIDELQDSRDAVVERGIKLILTKVKTINEFRKELGMPPVKWGDEPVAPFQQMSAIPMQPGAEGGEGGTPAPKPAPAQNPPPAPAEEGEIPLLTATLEAEKVAGNGKLG